MRNFVTQSDNHGLVGKSARKLLTTTALTAAGFLSIASAQAQDIPADTWSDHVADQGSIDINTDIGNKVTDIQQNTNTVKVRGDGDIRADWTVNIDQLSSNSKYVLFDTEADATNILGKLNANGQVYIFDQNGVIFGENSQVDVGSIVAAAGVANYEDVISGKFKITDIEGDVSNAGTINVAANGLAAFVGRNVTNTGVINAKIGRVAMGSGAAVTVDLHGDNLFEIALEDKLEDALIENSGEILAEGGEVLVTAQAAKNAIDSVINMDGIIDVSSATVQGGRIVLSGGNSGAVSVSGTLNATSTADKGGDIEITGQTVVAENGSLIDASGATGGGDILFGGDFQGQGDTPKSDYALVDTNAIIRSDATEEGDGGTVIVWSEVVTGFYGFISSQGASNGEGGLVETSSKDYLESSGNVLAGEWLLDPRNLTITNSTNFNRSIVDTAGLRTITAVGTNGGNTSFVSDGTIESALNNGTDVTLKTGPQDNGDGDIFVNAQIDKTAGGEATLRLEAHDDIFVNNDIVSTSGELNVELIAEAFGGRSGTQTVDVNDSIRTNGGYVFVEGEDVNINDDIISAGGDITLVAKNDNVDINSGGDLFSGGGKITIDADQRFFAHNNATLDSTGSAGDILIEADIFDLDGTINAGDAKVTIGHNDQNGQIDVGDSNGAGLRIDQAELNRITAGTLEIGQQNTGVDNNVQIDNANFFAFAQTIINTKTPDNGVTQNVLFQGSNTFKGLTVNADDNITIDASAFVNAFGDIEFNTDTNTGGIGSFNVGAAGRVDSNGNNITVNTLNVNLGANAEVDAEGGNIDFNNTGVFSSVSADSVITEGTGAIEINQNGGTVAGGTIQNAVDAVNNQGTGRNTIFVSEGLWEESVTIAEDNFTISGNNAGTPGTAARAAETIIAPNSPGFLITGNNTILDGVSITGADNGVKVLGAANTIIRNNIVDLSTLNGIFFQDASGANFVYSNLITNTTNSAVSVLNTSDTTKIYSNTITTANAGVRTQNTGLVEVGVDGANTISDTKIGIFARGTGDLVANNNSITGTRDGIVTRAKGNTTADNNIIDATDNGIEFGPFDAELDANTVVLTNNTITAGTDGIHFVDKIGGGSIVDIKSNDITGNDDGIEFADGIDDSTVTIADNTAITGTTGNGINFGANTVNGRSFNGGTTEIKNNTINGNEDGIKVSGVVSGTANVTISDDNDITGQQNGISFEEVISGSSTVKIDDNTSIEGVNGDGVEFQDVISGSATVEVTDNDSIVAGENGVSFEDTISGSATITVSENNDGIEADDHGIYFGGTITGDADIDILDNIIQANLDEDGTGSGIWFDGTINNADITIGSGSGGNGDITNDPSNVIFVAKNTSGSNTNLDGIHFDNTIGNNADIEIDGNRIGYKAPAGLGGAIVGGFTNEIANDGIAFDGEIEGNADIDITDNFINSDDEGIEFDEDISDTANIEIGGGSNDTNTIIADDNAIQFGGKVTDQSLIEISYNDIDAFGNGIVFSDIVDNAITSGSNEQEIYIAYNDINVDEDGIVFSEDIRNARHDQLIKGNTIDAEENGIVYEQDIDDAHVRIIYENDINALFDAIAVRDDLQNGARLDINDNTNIIAQLGDGVAILDAVFDSTLNIQNNDNIDAGDNGIEINGIVSGSTVNIIGNNDGITANNHGIYFGSAIRGNTTLNIHDNIIDANDNGGSTGDGIRFDGEISNSDINIGDGSLPGGSDRSNIISGRDGIYFADTVGEGADVEIDGNRIGFAASSLTGTLFNARLTDDGIQFSNISGDANINITENAIRAGDKGVVVNGIVDGTATVTVGGTADLANAINALGDGVAFNEDVTENALIEVSYNDIDVNGNGIAFYGDIDNVAPIGISQEEILLTNNDIDIYDTGNGILFDGEISDNRHDTRIANNNILVRDGGNNGITFNDTIDDASIWIVDGNDIDGDEDGIVFNGEILNNARIRIHDNYKIAGDDQDGIDFNGDITSGSFVSIIDNDIINGDLFGLESSFDSGIEFDGEINDAKIQILENNDGIMAEDHGIAFNADIVDGSDIDIHDNIIMSNTDNGEDGAGIWFGGKVKNSTINIGDGTLNGAPSNIISVGDNFSSDDVSELDGIHFADTVGKGAEVLIDGNRIGYKYGKEGLFVNSIPDDGIEFNKVNRDATVGITDNRIYADDDGIQFSGKVTNSALVTIGEVGEDLDGNIIYAGDDGISFLKEISEDAVANINTNEIYAEDDGVYSRGGMRGGELNIVENITIEGGNNGVNVIGKLEQFEGEDAKILIDSNEYIQGYYGDGVHIEQEASEFDGYFGGYLGRFELITDGYYGGYYGGGVQGVDIDILNNVFGPNGSDGIEISAYDAEVLIDTNDIGSNAQNGILLNAKQNFFFREGPSDFESEERASSVFLIATPVFGPEEFNSVITNNDIYDNGDRGLYVKNAGHDDVEVTGNVFENNPTHAEFESGLIDLTNTDEETGFGNEFLGGDVGLYFSPFDGDPTLLSLVDNDAPGFQTLEDTSTPTNFGGTIGQQFFDGQSESFVRLDNTAFRTPGGEHTWLNGLDSTYATPFGTIRPSDTGGVLTLDQFNFLEDQFDHFPDTLNTGIFFFGFVPLIDQEDIFNIFDPANLEEGGFSATVTGPVSIPGAPQDVANITPFAGGEGGEVTPESLNEIETAAGSGTQSTCWSDALNSAGAGEVSSLSAGISFEDRVAGATGCASGPDSN